MYTERAFNRLREDEYEQIKKIIKQLLPDTNM